MPDVHHIAKERGSPDARQMPPTSGAQSHPFNLRQALDRFERGYIQNVLTLAAGNVQDAAAMLGIAPGDLERKLQQYRDES